MFTLNCRGSLLLIAKPLVMGIINITPDSFYAGSRQPDTDAALRQAERMLADGAALLDIGGQSTRPGSEKISAATEMERILGPVRAIHDRFPDAVISVDTYYAAVARAAVEAGASLVNDISGGRLDPEMIPVVASLGVPFVLMHMKGSPQDMLQHAQYTDVSGEVLDDLAGRMAICRAAGIKDLIVDPGIGFAKTAEQNFRLLHDLPVFKPLEAPLLLGISRKSFIWKTLGVSAADELALTGTTALHMAGLMGGASLLRVHDVKEAVSTIRLFEELKGTASKNP